MIIRDFYLLIILLLHLKQKSHFKTVESIKENWVKSNPTQRSSSRMKTFSFSGAYQIVHLQLAMHHIPLEVSCKCTTDTHFKTKKTEFEGAEREGRRRKRPWCQFHFNLFQKEEKALLVRLEWTFIWIEEFVPLNVLFFKVLRGNAWRMQLFKYTNGAVCCICCCFKWSSRLRSLCINFYCFSTKQRTKISNGTFLRNKLRARLSRRPLIILLRDQSSKFSFIYAIVCIACMHNH